VDVSPRRFSRLHPITIRYYRKCCTASNELCVFAVQAVTVSVALVKKARSKSFIYLKL
jgi:hypothetical protein